MLNQYMKFQLFRLAWLAFDGVTVAFGIWLDGREGYQDGNFATFLFYLPMLFSLVYFFTYCKLREILIKAFVPAIVGLFFNCALSVVDHSVCLNPEMTTWEIFREIVLGLASGVVYFFVYFIFPFLIVYLGRSLIGSLRKGRDTQGQVLQNDISKSK